MTVINDIFVYWFGCKPNMKQSFPRPLVGKIAAKNRCKNITHNVVEKGLLPRKSTHISLYILYFTKREMWIDLKWNHLQNILLSFKRLR